MKKIDKLKIEFNERFANGEQYIDLDLVNGKIVQLSKNYYWQQREVYNHIRPIIESLQARHPSLNEDLIYGKDGIVESLIPIQRAYNAIMNQETEYLNRLINAPFICEDGSVDIDTLECDGVGPGKILIYRQGAREPKSLTDENSADIVELISNNRSHLLTEFSTICQYWDSKLTRLIG